MLLAFESSCDETSVAVVSNATVLSNVVSSQIQMHADYGGVVPELASREHLRNLLPVASSALAQAGVTLSDINAIAATRGPGLPGALMVGLKAAQTLAYVHRCPFYAVNHHEAHLYSPWISGTPPAANFSDFEPNVSLIVSGGHTMLVHVLQPLAHRLLGGTIDDAAGEAFDKIGKMIGLPYPAGPHIDKLASEGDPLAFSFPRPMLHDSNDEFSFSGLKTSVKYFLRDHPHILSTRKDLANLCASVQNAIVEVLTVKTVRAAKQLRVGCVTASGGVICNSRLRYSLSEHCSRAGLRLRLAEKSLSTDNAAMIGVVAELRQRLGRPSDPLDTDILPGMEIA